MRIGKLVVFVLFTFFLLVVAANSVDAASIDLEYSFMCDEGNTLIDRVYVCFNDTTVTPDIIRNVSVLSIEGLARRAESPTPIPYPVVGYEDSVTGLYFEPGVGEEKEVSLLLTLEFDPYSEVIESNLELIPTATNFLNGERMFLVHDGDYYLLWYDDDGGDFFSMDNLRISSIPLMTTYVAEPVLGTGFYSFFMDNDQVISIGDLSARDGDSPDYFTAVFGERGESPESYPLSYDLTERYEVTFTKERPVRIINPDLGTLIICSSDLGDADPLNVKVCRQDAFGQYEETLNLRRDVLTRPDGLDSYHQVLENYAFLYEQVEGEKRVSIFDLYDIDESPEDLDYNDFITALTNERRLAIQTTESDVLHLITHNSTVFSLTNIEIVAHEEDGTRALLTIGNEESIEVPTSLGGKVFIDRFFGNPSPPFELSFKTLSQLEPVDLEADFDTYVTSDAPTTFSNPTDFISVHVSDNDLPDSNNYFRLEYGSSGAVDLELDVPTVIDTSSPPSLWYYETYEARDQLYFKKAEIYRLLDISTSPVDLVYSSDFISTLREGAHLALKVSEDSYYILSHDTFGLTPFNINNLKIQRLGGSTVIASSPVDTSVVSFQLPEGDVYVVVDELAQSFSVEMDRENLVEFEGYLEVLTPTNTVVVSGGPEFYLCNQDLYFDRSSAKVCDARAVDTLDPVIVENPERRIATVGVDQKEYLFEANGLTGGDKQVTISELIRLDVGTTFPEVQESWVSLTSNISVGEVPTFAIEDGLYNPVVGASIFLEDFSFEERHVGTEIPYIEYVPITPVSGNATYPLGGYLLFINQTETIDNVYYEMTLLDIPYLGYDDLVIDSSEGDSDTTFRTTMAGDDHSVSLLSLEDDLVLLRVENLDTGEVLLEREFASGEGRTLTIDGVRVHIEVTIDQDDEVQVVISRE